MNQVIIQSELESFSLSATNGTFVTKGEIEGVFKKLLSISPFFVKFSKSDLNLLFLIQHHLEEIREAIVTKFNKILIGKTHVWIKDGAVLRPSPISSNPPATSKTYHQRLSET